MMLLQAALGLLFGVALLIVAAALFGIAVAEAVGKATAHWWRR